jgi:hypothetical protein
MQMTQLLLFHTLTSLTGCYYLALSCIFFPYGLIKANKLALNDQKIKFAIFSRSAIPDNRIIDSQTFDDHTVSRSMSMRYLGVVLDQNLTWREHINAVCDKVAKGIGILRFLSHQKSVNFLLPIYNALG